MLSAKKELFTPSGGGYQISRSVRIRQSASAYLNRTPASAGNRKTWTWSGWVKIGKAASTGLFTASTSGSNMYTIQLGVNGELSVYAYTGTYPYFRNTSAVFRDYSAWYHFVVAFDSTQATDTNRIKIYVNGVLQSTTSGSGSGWPTLNYDGGVNNTINHQFSDNVGGASYFDGYLTEVNFIDGQALTPSSFGETNALTGVWQPKRYAGTYGTNGFYLNFSDNSSNTATTIGKDYSGNSNNWTPNNISVTAGTTYDSMLDVPTQWADGGNGRGNYATWNPIDHPTTFIAPTNGNLSQNCNTAAWTLCVPTFAIPDGSGLWQWELIQTGTANGANAIGVCLTTVQASVTGAPSSRVGCSGVDNVGTTFINGATSGSITYPTVGNTITCLYDATNRTFQVFDNGTSKGTITGLPAGDVRPFVAASSSNGSPTFVANFGQTTFAYNKGGKALNTLNLPDATIKNGASYMAATTYTGTGSALTIANTVGSASFQPDLVWVKSRSAATDHALYDAVRGVQNQLESNNTAAETTETTGLTAFGSTGFTVGALAQMNTSAATYVAWQWNAGGSTVTNTSGSISAQVRANTTAGFSVVTYTGNGLTNQSIGHGLGATPGMVIIKQRDGTASWLVHHQSQPTGYTVYLNLTNAQDSGTSQWGTSPQTSTLFYVGYTAGATGSNVSASTYVAYCWAPVAGYSAFGSYTGNGSADGPFVYTGFRVKYLLCKRTDAAEGWQIIDAVRNPYNVANTFLEANQSNAEGTSSARDVDFLSNGFKIRNTSNAMNASGGTYIFAAFAENPLKFANAR